MSINIMQMQESKYTVRWNFPSDAGYVPIASDSSEKPRLLDPTDAMNIYVCLSNFLMAQLFSRGRLIPPLEIWETV